MTPIAYELKVETKSFLGEKRQWAFVVVATNHKEVEEEIECVMTNHYKEVETWNISEWVNEEILKPDSNAAKEFAKNGCYSCYR